METDKTEEFFKNLKVQLKETSSWPSVYMYKFIVLSDEKKINQLQSVFDNIGAVIVSKKSKNGKYTSLTIKVSMKNPEAVVAKYKEVTPIEGVISL